jgi:formate-dependent nitrite reductase membrane component NrfD
MMRPPSLCLPQSIIWAGVRAAADVLIAAALIYHQQTNRTTIAHSDNRFQRVAMSVLSTGSVAAVLSLLILILFVTRPDTHVSLASLDCV